MKSISHVPADVPSASLSSVASAPERANCALCNTEGEFCVSARDTHPAVRPSEKVWSVYLCPKCKVGFSAPALIGEALSAHYPPEYEPFVPKRGMDRWLFRLKYWMDLRLFRRMKAGSRLSLFEIGAGCGEFAFAAQSDGFEVQGIEPSDVARQHAYECYGLRLIPSSADAVEFKEAFDVVVARHVLEHINDPKQVLQRILLKGLKENGMLVLKLPSLDSWEFRFFGKFWGDLDLPRHRFHFTRNGISRLLKEVGYGEVWVKGERVPSSLMRSIENLARDGNKGFLKTLCATFCKLPRLIRFGIAGVVVLLLSPLGPSRMVAVARRT